MPMLNLTYDEKFANLTIQDHWKKGHILQYVGVALGTGKLISVNQNYNIENLAESTLKVINEFDIESLRISTDSFVEVTIMSKVIQIPSLNCCAIFGEGQMGNEGFVAVTRSDSLIWSAFFTNSNPFYELNLLENSLIAKSTHEVYWEFPIYQPWNITLSM